MRHQVTPTQAFSEDENYKQIQKSFDRYNQKEFSHFNRQNHTVIVSPKTRLQIKSRKNLETPGKSFSGFDQKKHNTGTKVSAVKMKEGA